MNGIVLLTAMKGPLDGKSIILNNHETVMFGRAKECNKGRMPRTDLQVARRQFVVEVALPRVRLWDLGGTNRTRVNGKPYGRRRSIGEDQGVQRSEGVELNDGDQIEAGNSLFRVSVKTEMPSTLRFTQSGRRVGLMAVQPGDGPPVIPGYQIVRKLGRGIGTCHLRKRSQDGMEVVTKVFRSTRNLPTAARQALSRDLVTLCRLRHKHIVALSDFGLTNFGEDGSAVCLEIEFCGGGDLLQMVGRRGGRLSAPIVYGFMRDLFEALEFAHEKHLVHQGIKRENILLSTSQSCELVKLADFSLGALLRKYALQATVSEAWDLNTYPFLSREQILKPSVATPANDIWSLAAVCYWSLTGQYPREASRGENAVATALANRIIPIRDRYPRIPQGREALFALIDSALAGQFRTASELNSAIKRLPPLPILMVG